ncbi:MAG: helix-turn-helix domain-containing protein [Promicromonosporaceae bacterium]|nr:helix-turn-helix domain-containing protein [Promicromonosporaceae bacterium]
MPNSVNSQALRSAATKLNQVALRRVSQELPWYADLSPEIRKQVGQVAAAGINAFVAWYADRSGPPSDVSAMFDAAPRELAQHISLQQTLALVRVVVDSVEETASVLPGGSTEVRDAILRYSRDVAFSAAEIYAVAAEARGAQDARLEALAVDYLIRGDDPAGVASRAAALGWVGKGTTTVVVGTADPALTETGLRELRRALRKSQVDALVGVSSGRLLLVLGGEADPAELTRKFENRFGPGPIIIGTAEPSITQASASAAAALSAYAVVGAWPEAPRLISATELLPERALAGEEAARQDLVAQCYRPLVAAGHGLVETLAAYLETGRSLESASRAIAVHPNTVRARLRKIAEVTGWEPLDPREGFTLHVALVLGRLSDLAGGGAAAG